MLFGGSTGKSQNKCVCLLFVCFLEEKKKDSCGWLSHVVPNPRLGYEISCFASPAMKNVKTASMETAFEGAAGKEPSKFWTPHTIGWCFQRNAPQFCVSESGSATSWAASVSGPFFKTHKKKSRFPPCLPENISVLGDCQWPHASQPTLFIDTMQFMHCNDTFRKGPFARVDTSLT